MIENCSKQKRLPQEHFRDPIPGTPATPGSGGRSTGRTPAITPGAMSMAGAGRILYLKL